MRRMERTFFSAGLLCLAVASCGLEHPISRNLDVPCPCPDRAELPDASDVPPSEDRVIPVDAPDAGRSDVVDVPMALDAPDVVDAPPGMDVVDAPALPDIVDVPLRPDIVDAPALPDIVDAPALPDIVDVPLRPDIVDVPMLPDVFDAGPPVYESCEEVRTRGLPTGAYLIRAGASTPWLALCDTSDNAGAWTLVLKADGQRTTFSYDAPLWTNADLLAPQSANLDRVEAKFQGFLTLPVRAIRLQIVTPASSPTGAVNALVLDRLFPPDLRQTERDHVERGKAVSLQILPPEGERIRSPCSWLRKTADKFGQLCVPATGKKIHLQLPYLPDYVECLGIQLPVSRRKWSPRLCVSQHVRTARDKNGSER